MPSRHMRRTACKEIIEGPSTEWYFHHLSLSESGNPLLVKGCTSYLMLKTGGGCLAFCTARTSHTQGGMASVSGNDGPSEPESYGAEKVSLLAFWLLRHALSAWWTQYPRLVHLAWRPSYPRALLAPSFLSHHRFQQWKNCWTGLWEKDTTLCSSRPSKSRRFSSYI